MSAHRLSRRSFFRKGASLAGAACLPLSERGAMAVPDGSPRTVAYRYPCPGRIAIIHHSGVVRGYNNVDTAVVQTMFDEGIMRFTGITSSPADALASLFPGLSGAKKIAIKPNLINSSVPTRKELVKAVITRLLQMNGGFPAQNITMYEMQSFSGSGYTTAYFGQNVRLVYDAGFPDLGYRIVCDGKARPYSRNLYEADYLINMPVLKDHGCSMDFTLSFKNHMGTVNPGGSLGICSNERAVLDIMADAVLVSKQRLVILDALFAVCNGGPGGSPQASPCTILIGQDPVTVDYHGRKMLNELRIASGLNAKNGSYIERAAASPYSIGIADPGAMTIVRHSVTGDDPPSPAPLAWSLSDCYPNPFTERTQFTLELRTETDVIAEVYSSSGALVRSILQRTLPPGIHHFGWSASLMPPGVYLLRARIGGAMITRKMILLR